MSAKHRRCWGKMPIRRRAMEVGAGVTILAAAIGASGEIAGSIIDCFQNRAISEPGSDASADPGTTSQRQSPVLAPSEVSTIPGGGDTRVEVIYVPTIVGSVTIDVASSGVARGPNNVAKPGKGRGKQNRHQLEPTEG